jgi:hypothetical protein
MPFAETLAGKKAEHTTFWKTADEFNAGLRADQELYFKSKFPKRKKIDFDLVKDDDAFKAIFDRWKVKADELYADHKKAEEEFDAKLMDEALEDIPATTILGQVYTSYSSTYRSQGFGASNYAEKAAESKADIARFYGFHAEVKPVGSGHRTNDGCHYQDYGLFVNTTEVGWEMLIRRPGPSLREWLKMCWKRGVNPRVYNPFLPPGVEEKYGIDYFGNDLVKA